MGFTPEQILAGIAVHEEDGVWTVVLPRFIRSVSDLVLSVEKAGGRYYVHENGCILRHWKENGIYPYFEENREALEGMFGFVLADGCLQRGYVREERGFFDFLKNLIFLIELPLLQPYLKIEKRYDTEDYRLPGEGTRPEAIPDFGRRIRPKCPEKDGGHLLLSGISYSDSDTAGSSVFFREAGDGTVCLEDGETHFPFHREALDRALQESGDPAPWEKAIRSVCACYGVKWRDRKILMHAEPDAEHLRDACFRFLQAAVLLSEVGEGGMLCKTGGGEGNGR